MSISAELAEIQTCHDEAASNCHRRSLKVDRHLMVKGTTDIFALGDAATIDQV